MKHTWLIGAAVLQSACSLLIRVDDGLEDDPISQGGSTGDTAGDAGAAADGGTGGSEAYSSGDGDAGLVAAGGSDTIAGSGGAAGSEPDAGGDADVPDDIEPRKPVFDLAFIEDRAESEAALRLVSTELALSSPSDEEDPPWRISLRPADQVGDVLDFAWSPDGERIAVRFQGLRGPRMAFFEAPDWHEVERDEVGVLIGATELDVTDRYRWSPGSDAIAVELTGGPLPLVSGYVIAETIAHGMDPIALDDTLESMDWRSATSLYLVESVAEAPVLHELRLTQARQLEPGLQPSDLGLFLPVDLRHVPGGVLGGSDDASNSLFFWPEVPDAGGETAFQPTAYTSDNQAFVLEVDDPTEARVYPIEDSLNPVDVLPGCATVLAWAAGPDRRSLTGSKIACLPVQEEPAVVSIHTFDTNAQLTTLTVDDETLRADLAVTESWEGHARGFAPGGRFLALASSAHDVLIDLRGASPQLRISDAVGAGNTSRAFSPSGAFVLRQRGQLVDAVAVSASPELRPFDLTSAFVDMPPCELAHHSTNWCGARSAARRASARWSFSRDVGAHLTSEEGLWVIGASTDPVSVTHQPVSTCGASCVGQYEFGR